MSDYRSTHEINSFQDFLYRRDTDYEFWRSIPIELQMAHPYVAYQRLCCSDGKPLFSPNIKAELSQPLEKERNLLEIVPFESLLGKDLADAGFLLLNRESAPGQSHGHEAKMRALRTAHASLGIKPPILEDTITASGKLDILAGKSTSSPDYFSWLRERIGLALEQTPFGKTLFVMFATPSRLMRPMGYDYRNAPMLPYTERDYELFNDWLHRSFPERAKEIVFTALKLDNPQVERGFETKLGKEHFDNPGGRPRNLKTAKGRKRFKQILCDEAVELARTEGMNAAGILRYFEKKYKNELRQVKLFGKRRVEQLLKKAGCSSKPGRPKKLVMPF